MSSSARLSPQQLRQYRDEGYFILEDFFESAEMDELCARIDVFDEELNRQLATMSLERRTAGVRVSRAGRRRRR